MTPQMLDDTTVEHAMGKHMSGTTAIGDCVRCGGMMVPSRYIDMLDDTGQLEFIGARCIQCGDVSDPVIRRNRIRQATLDRPPAHELSRVA
ncbi:MAG TPA: hypothetical protein VJ692_01580 [Nitrospiraceae bacterium]|nr:hypothetical protein [Nitrospiraceae bacterium]